MDTGGTTPFDAPSLTLDTTLCPPLHPHITSLCSSNSHLLLSHSNLLSLYNPTSLHLTTTFPTHLPHITSLTSPSPLLASLGSHSSPGLHFYSLATTSHVSSVFWHDPTDPRTQHAAVAALGSRGEKGSVFAGFECRHGEGAVVEVDSERGEVVGEMGRGGRGRGLGVKKLTWVEGAGVVVGTSVTRTAFGYSGFVKAWDPRSGEEVWEVSQPGGMAGVDVDGERAVVARVGAKSGVLGLMDLRVVGKWECVEEPGGSGRGSGVFGRSVVVCCYKGSVFVGVDGALEAWSRVGEGEGGVYRRYYVDKEEDERRGVIRMVQGGGDRLFVCREDVEGVEVWQSSNESGVRPVSL